MKSGWHPEKNGGSITNSVKGLVGKGDSTSSSREEHVAIPRSSLRDPASFAPPPKHVAAYGRTPSAPAQPPAAARTSFPYPSTPTMPTQSSAADPAYQAHVEAEPEMPAEPRPYRVDTTGLSTSHLPPPPTRSGGGSVGGRAPQLPAVHSPAPTTTTPQTTAAKPRAPPSLPPRLPPRSGNSSPIRTIEQAAGQGQVNQGAVSRLGAAGINVPGLGIGGGDGAPPQGQSSGQVNELQARFARLGASSPSQASGPAPAALNKKKPPPPPMPKKFELKADNIGAPPPVPLATRPRFD
ncbi:hypothetical protein F4808DRAFT_459196 [Astrocystis sublimbata]|nr:hypothetical protein F4808DRAFT_459196 [Astrocystis sublimbata]